jgi:TonB family protein
MKISVLALSMCLSVASQSESFETRAISAAQRIPASSLDEKLPNRSFGDWLNEVVGQGAGVVWQLAECGAGSQNGNGLDVPACAEVTVLLPNGNKVIIGISVGTFKKGLIGNPAFMGAVIDSGQRLYKVGRLSDLPGALRPTRGIIRLNKPNQPEAPNLPSLEPDTLQVIMAPPILSPGENNFDMKFTASDEAEAPPPPASKQNSGDLVGANVISSVKPAYPPAARNMRLSGNVEVKVVISETGHVTDAKALNGPMMLQGAAEAAARQWVYKPATRNGVPMKTESVITFTFGPGSQ